MNVNIDTPLLVTRQCFALVNSVILFVLLKPFRTPIVEMRQLLGDFFSHCPCVNNSQNVRMIKWHNFIEDRADQLKTKRSIFNNLKNQLSAFYWPPLPLMDQPCLGADS